MSLCKMSLCWLGVVSLAFAALSLPRAAYGITFSDSDIHNAARRMTSLSEQVHETRKRLEAAPFFKSELRGFSAVTQARGDMVPNLPIVLDTGVEQMELIRGYTEVSLQLADDDRWWTVAFTAAGLAYGLNREYDLSTDSLPLNERPANFDELGGRAGGDAHGDQFMDAVYLLHGKIGEFRYELGYLQSSVIHSEIGTTVFDAERERTGQWATGMLEWRDLKVVTRRDLLGEAGIDFVSVDWGVLQSLDKFDVGGGSLGSPKLPKVKLLLEYTRFASVGPAIGGGAGASGYAPGRGDDLLIGFDLMQDFIPLMRDAPPSEIIEKGGFEALWLGAQGHYGLSSGVVRDTSLRAGTTYWFSPTMDGHLIALQLHAGYSTYTDEAALPYLLQERDATSVGGYLLRAATKLRLKDRKTGKFWVPVFHFIAEFRSNWAPDLARVVEFTNTPIVHLGMAVTFGF